jgi:hypothetical protein
MRRLADPVQEQVLGGVDLELELSAMLPQESEVLAKRGHLRRGQRLLHVLSVQIDGLRLPRQRLGGAVGSLRTRAPPPVPLAPASVRPLLGAAPGRS